MGDEYEEAREIGSERPVIAFAIGQGLPGGLPNALGVRGGHIVGRWRVQGAFSLVVYVEGRAVAASLERQGIEAVLLYLGRHDGEGDEGDGEGLGGRLWAMATLEKGEVRIGWRSWTDLDMWQQVYLY